MQCEARLSIGVRRIQIYAEREAEEVTKQCAKFLTFTRDEREQVHDDIYQQQTLLAREIPLLLPNLLFF